MLDGLRKTLGRLRRGMGRMRRNVGGIRRRFRYRRFVRTRMFGLILNYHRVTPDPGGDPHMLCVTPHHFSAQLEWLRRDFDIVTLSALFIPVSGRPRVALTFDDGYADNLHHALPILEQYETPATVFVMSGQVDSGREFWWDELDRLVLRTRRDPVRFEVETSAGIRAFAAMESERMKLFYDLHSLLKPLCCAEQQAILARLREIFLDAPPPRMVDLPLTRIELGRLARSPLIRIGGHTVNHVALGCRPLSEQRQEIEHCLTDLRDWTGQEVDVFSYPYGTTADIGSDASEIVRQSGCQLARANWPGVITQATDCYHLPGLIVRNWDARTFACRITDFLGGGEYNYS